jgi:hypothetical protein
LENDIFTNGTNVKPLTDLSVAAKEKNTTYGE